MRRLPRRAGAHRWVKSKMAGTRQLMAVIFNSYPAADRIGDGEQPAGSLGRHLRAVPLRARSRSAPRLRVITKFKDDEANTRTETVLMMLVGGGDPAASTARTWGRAFISATPPRIRSARDHSVGRISEQRRPGHANLSRRRRQAGGRRARCHRSRCSASIATIGRRMPSRSGPRRGRRHGEWPDPSQSCRS